MLFLHLVDANLALISLVADLNNVTHDPSKPHVRELYAELDEAIDKGVHILLAHELRPGKGGTTFMDIIDSTPTHLRDELDENGAYLGKRLYKELAVGICDGPHLPPSLHLLLGAIAVAPPIARGKPSESFHGSNSQNDRISRPRPGDHKSDASAPSSSPSIKAPSDLAAKLIPMEKEELVSALSSPNPGVSKEKPPSGRYGRPC